MTRHLATVVLGGLLLALQLCTGTYAIGDGFEVKYLEVQPESSRKGRRLASSGRRLYDVLFSGAALIHRYLGRMQLVTTHA